MSSLYQFWNRGNSTEADGVCHASNKAGGTPPGDSCPTRYLPLQSKVFLDAITCVLLVFAVDIRLVYTPTLEL